MLTVAVPKRNKLQNIIVLTPKDGNRSVGIWKSGRPVSLCKKIEMQYQICYTEQWYKRKYNKKRNANESE